MAKALICIFLRCLVLFAVFSILQGCVPIPWVQKLPFDEKALAFIKQGVTKRGEVENIFGKPDAVCGNSSISLYNKKRLMALLISQYGLGEMGTDHVLMIQYGDDDIVKSYEVLRLGMAEMSLSGFKEACSTNGLCIVGTPYGGLVVFDGPEADLEAKLFNRDEHRCSVYLYYSDYSSLGSNIIHVCPFTDKSQRYAIYEGGYFHWLEEPGSITVGANTIQQESDSCLSEHLFECEAGQLYFIHVHEELGILSGNSLKISADNLEKGKQSILERRLMLP